MRWIQSTNLQKVNILYYSLLQQKTLFLLCFMQVCSNEVDEDTQRNKTIGMWEWH